MAIASSIVAGMIMGGAGIFGAAKSASAANRATQHQLQSNNAAMAYERERDLIEREQYDKEYARRVQLEDERLKRELEERAIIQAERDRQFALEREMFEKRLALDATDQAFRHDTFNQRQARLDQFRDGPGTYRTLGGLLTVPRNGTLADFLGA